jgi:glycosyltransferase involved in cell wall biosynthesis
MAAAEVLQDRAGTWPGGRRPVVLVLLGAAWPGSDASGPVQSFRAMAAALKDEFEFRLIARDRASDRHRPEIEAGRWIDLGYALANHYRAGAFGAKRLGRLLRETPHDLLMLNGFFDRELTIPALMLRRLGVVPRKPVILSPRGEFSGGALGLKSGRKAAYLRLSASLRLLDDVALHATSAAEHSDIRAHGPAAHDVVFAPNVRLLVEPRTPRPAEDASVVRLAFIGRISPVKNLNLALHALALVKSRVVFSIFGPKESAEYWSECMRLIAALPPHVEVRDEGEIANEQVPDALAACDIFFLPSRSENFGHAIFEALSCGVPVLIGDQTPWRQLERASAGWDLPLDDPRDFAEVIDTFSRLGPEQRKRLQAGARALAEAFVSRNDTIEQTRAMLRSAIERGCAA